MADRTEGQPEAAQSVQSIRERIMQNGTGLRETEITIPAWHGKFIVRELTAGQRDDVELATQTARASGKPGNVRGNLVVRSLCTLSREPVFRPEDADWVSRQPIHIIQPIFNEIARLSSITESDIDDLEGKSDGRI